MAEGKNFLLQNEMGAETVTHTEEEAQHDWKGYASRFRKCSDFHLCGVFGRDSQLLAHLLRRRREKHKIHQTEIRLGNSRTIELEIIR